ncbi:unnamed protein product [Alternaria sp. RS040]
MANVTTTAPGFLRLPLEIRQQIYHCVLVQDFRSQIIKMTVQQQHSGDYKLRGLKNIRGLVFVSRTFHAEVLTYCFSRFNFFLHNDSESIRFVVREFFRKIGLKNRKLVKRITLPYFSIERVLLHPANMVALFASSQARSLQLLDDMQHSLRLLEHFSALEELDLGLDTAEVLGRRGNRLRFADRHRRAQAHSMGREERIAQAYQRDYESHIMMALQEVKWLPAKVNVGIWWTSGRGESLGTDKETADDLDDFVSRLRKEIAPTRVTYKGDM